MTFKPTRKQAREMLESARRAASFGRCALAFMRRGAAKRKAKAEGRKRG